ncbi:uncharacterized protein C1orf159 homolog isoform X2 [Lissotriton helveticus]
MSIRVGTESRFPEQQHSVYHCHVLEVETKYLCVWGLTDSQRFWFLPVMAWPNTALLLSRLTLQVATESVGNLVSLLECCMEQLDSNGSCPTSNRCSPGCFRHWSEDGHSTCVKCKNESSLQEGESLFNLTECRNASGRVLELHMNTSTTAPDLHSIGSPEVAVSLLLGTLFISLFLILSVASFFYLKRANRLPDVFYRKNKASILQPSETASMIPTPSSSVRKPRYVRRERSLVMSASAAPNQSKETRVSNV